MKQQLVSLAIINQTLNIPTHTTLTQTITYIHQLTAFRKQHQLCNNIIYTLRDQLAKLQLTINMRTNQYLNDKLALAKVESERLFNFDTLGSTLASVKTKKYPKYQTFEQFMNDEFQISSTKCKQKQSKLKLNHSLSHCCMPISTIISHIQQKESQRQVEPLLEQKLQLSDVV